MERGRVLTEGALAGIRVVDFTWVRAGPQATRILSMFGAEVIRIEWPLNPDLSRIGYAQSKSLESQAGDFNNFSCNKLSVTLSVRHPAGLDLIKRLIAVSDVVIENFSSRVLEGWGLGFDVLKEVNPAIIYVSMAGFGHSGPHRDYITYGPSVQALCGLTFLSGEPDKPPAGWGYSYMDHTGGYYGAMAVLTALHYRHRTGQGQYIDLSQVEAGCTLTGAAVLDYTVNDRPSRRAGIPSGNRTHWPGTPLTNSYRGPQAAPHNHYPCAGGGHNDWCVIACFTETEWQALVEVIGEPDWARELKFATLLGRLQHQTELDQRIGAWTSQLGKYEVMERLQAAGVPAAPVQGMDDRLDRDPQLRHRGTYATRREHPVHGERPYEGMPMQMSETPWQIWRHGPLLGQDQEYVFGEILGLSSDELADLDAAGVFWPKQLKRE